jgi:hypothetical protein
MVTLHGIPLFLEAAEGYNATEGKRMLDLQPEGSSRAPAD